MKSPLTTCQTLLALSAAAMLAPTVQAQITGFGVNFNGSATTYTDNFQRWNADPQDPQGFTWGASLGTGGTGGLEVTNTGGNNIFYGAPGSGTASTFDIAGLTGGSANAAFSSSIDFVWADTSATALTTITFGLATTRVQNAMSSNGAFGGSIIRNGSSVVTLRMRNNNSNAATLNFDQSELTAGNWYRLSFDFAKDSVADQFSYTVSLFSIGADGTASPSLLKDGTSDITLTGTISNAAIYADSDAFFGYDIRDTSNNQGISHVDNFVVSSIPEPSAFAALAGLGALAAVGLRRRRRAA